MEKPILMLFRPGIINQIRRLYEIATGRKKDFPS